MDPLWNHKIVPSSSVAEAPSGLFSKLSFLPSSYQGHPPVFSSNTERTQQYCACQTAPLYTCWVPGWPLWREGVGTSRVWSVPAPWGGQRWNWSRNIPAWWLVSRSPAQGNCSSLPSRSSITTQPLSPGVEDASGVDHPPSLPPSSIASPLVSNHKVSAVGTSPSSTSCRSSFLGRRSCFKHSIISSKSALRQIKAPISLSFSTCSFALDTSSPLAWGPCFILLAHCETIYLKQSHQIITKRHDNIAAQATSELSQPTPLSLNPGGLG